MLPPGCLYPLFYFFLIYTYKFLGDLFVIIDEANIRKSVLKLVLPSVSEQVLIMVVGVVSTIFVGQLGKEAVSAVGLINTVVGFITVLFVALSTGCTVLVARLMGEEEVEKAKDAVRQSVILGAAVSFIVCVVCYILSMNIIRLLFQSADDQVINMANTYLRITLYTFPLALINIIVSGSLRGAGDTKTPMYIATIVNIVNIGLSLVMIFGFSVFSVQIGGYGFRGAAVAVAVSRAVGGILSISVFYYSKSIIRLNLFEKVKINISLIKRILHVGIPAAIEQMVMQGGFLVLQIVISGMGTAAIASYQIVMSINSISYIPIWGFGIAATTMIGQSLGAKKPELAEKCGWDTLKMGLPVTVILTAVVFALANVLVNIYSTDNEVRAIGATAIRIFSISQPFLSMVVIFSGALRGAGDIMYVMITSFVGIWGFRILLTVLLNSVFSMGIMGVWIALCADFFIRAVMYLFRYKKGRWKAIVV